MMLQQGVPGLLGNSGDGAAAAHQARESGGGGSGSGELGGGGGGSISGGFSEEERGRMEEGERNSGGNRWPRQETLALLKIRSDMDVAFRDSSLKGPLWDEVSRKLAELGYHRSSKKCKEKFENVYKYHKRTKEGRTSKADGKTYRFFDQLEALDTHPTTTAPLQLPQPPQPQPISSVPPVLPMPITSAPIVSQVSTVPSINPMVTVSQSNVIAPTSINPTSIVMPTPVPPPVVSQSQPLATNHHQSGHFLHTNMSGGMLSNSTSSSTSSDSEPPERRRKRKRKWKDFFGRLMKEVIDKQEELQMKFLSTLEKRERERMMREEAWRVQEMAKMNHEHDLLVQERSIAAAKDAAVISFLQKITEQQNAQNPNGAAPQLPIQIQIQENQPPPPPPPPPPVTPVPVPAPAPAPVVQQQQKPTPPQGPQPQSQPQPQPQQQPLAVVPVPMPATMSPLPSMKNMIVAKTDNGDGENNMLSPSPSRWPKAEVQALIKLRTTLDMKYQENGPKGPLWEEISSSMRKLGYNRNAKRCKEKWENINKYYKKVKESSKKRPEDSKTCPYFHQLDAIYREKAKSDGPFNPGFTIKPENQMAPIMARPEQQWPLPQDQQEHQQRRIESGMDIDENLDQNHEDDDDEDDEDEDEDEGAGYEIVTNKASSMATIE